MRIKTPLFSILAVAPFSPSLDTNSPPILTIDPQSLDQAAADLAPNVDIPVDKSLNPHGAITVNIAAMRDFRPKNIIKQTPFLRELQAAKTYALNGGSPADMEAKFPDVATVITIPSGQPQSQSQAKKSAIDDILSMVDTSETEQQSTANNCIENQIDDLIGNLLNAIFANQDFRTMEAAWRGAERLTQQVPSGSEHSVSLTMIPATHHNIDAILDTLGRRLANSPPDLILIDIPLSNTPHDMALLEQFMTVGETLLAPVIVPLSPRFLGIPEWSDFSTVRFIPSLLEGQEYGRWKTLAGRAGAGWTVPCVGNIMGRPLHKPEPGYSAQGLSEKEPLWVSGAWALGALCAKSVAIHGRATRFCDRSSVRLENLPLTETTPPSPLEVMMDVDRRADFRQANILPLTGTTGRDDVFVTGSTTLDGGPLKFRMFMSRITGFLIDMAMNHRNEIQDIETDLAALLSLYIQALGFKTPAEVSITAHEEQEGSTSLEITLTPDPEILPDSPPITFGFGW